MRLALPLEKLIDQLLKLPGIGPKTAQRLALYILKMPLEEAGQLAQAIIKARKEVFPCSNCGYLTDTDPCRICQDQSRDRAVLCIVEESSDIIAVERTGYQGRYFVLNKDFNLMEDNDLEALQLKPLIKKLESGEIEEIILALNPDIDGEIISRFLADMAVKYGVKATRLAYGIPVGGDIEFTDEITLRKALEGRKEL